MPANVRSIWLMPNSDDAAFLSLLIGDLAKRFGTPVSAPHLTRRGGTVAPGRLTEGIAVAASVVPVGETAALPSGDRLRARLLADAATESASTGKPIAIEAVGQ